ncbi:MAG: DUF4010 domain-containing protein [Candidatus Micrarchaeota archaeon]
MEVRMLAISLTLLEKLVLAVLIGGIIGLEREHTKKQTLLGLRTFSLISLLGMLLTELSASSYYIAASIGLVGIFAITLSFYFFKATHIKHSIGLTTVIMLPLTYILGMMISFNYTIEAIAATIIVAYVLIEKGEVHHLVEMISRREIVDFLIFSVIAFVIYPLIPSEGMDLLGHQINIQSFVLSVILISILSFVSHVIARVIKHNAVLYAAFFGGLISSLATVMLFARGRKVNLDAIKLSFTSSSAGSVLRDALLLLFLNLYLFRATLFLFALPILGFLLMTQYYSRQVNLSHFKFIYNTPLSLMFVVKFASVLFIVSTLTNAVFDVSHQLYYLALFVAGAVNSASVIASVAFLFTAGSLPSEAATRGIFLGLLGSAIAKIAVANRKEGWNYAKYILFLVW